MKTKTDHPRSTPMPPKQFPVLPAGKMTWQYTRAENGSVALTAGIDLVKSNGKSLLMLGFGKDPEGRCRLA